MDYFGINWRIGKYEKCQLFDYFIITIIFTVYYFLVLVNRLVYKMLENTFKKCPSPFPIAHGDTFNDDGLSSSSKAKVFNLQWYKKRRSDLFLINDSSNLIPKINSALQSYNKQFL